MVYCVRKTRFLFLLFGVVYSVHVFGESDPPAIKFIPNKNQWNVDVRFSARIPGGTMHITKSSFRYYLIDQKKIETLHHGSHTSEPDGATDETIRGQFVQSTFIGANPHAESFTFGQSPEYYNYFIGSDPSRWAGGVYAYQGILLRNFYNDIDLKVYSLGVNVKYDFVVAPYGDPSQIVVEYDGAESISLDNGNLYLKTVVGDIIEKRPVAYQIVDGKKIEVRCGYHLVNNLLTLCFYDSYDPCYELIIDPMLIFSTYSGSTADNWGSTATPGERGTLYSAGVTNQSSQGGVYPTTPGAFQRTYGGLYDVGILKYDSSGRQLLYSTFLGGSNSESAHSLIVNKNQELVVLGSTSSGTPTGTSFPTTTGAIDRTFNGGTNETNVVNYSNGSDIFVARISKDGTALLASTLLGGSLNDGMNPRGKLTKNYGDELRGDVVTDDAGNIFISTVTSSNNFPMVNAFDNSYNGGRTDGLVLKLNPELTSILFSSFLGGSGDDACHTIKLDSQGNIFVGGGTTSTNFPTTLGSYQKNLAGDADGWIAKIRNDGASILNATYTGTPAFDQVYILELDKNDEPYVFGQADNRGNLVPIVPVTIYRNRRSGQFIQKFDNNLTTLKRSTTVGSESGIPDISPTAFLVNDCGNIYLAGWAGRINEVDEINFWQRVGPRRRMPISKDAYQRSSLGSDFYFMVLTDDAQRFLYGTYMGGASSATHVDGGTSRFDKSGIVYHAVCSGCQYFNTEEKPTSDFPTTADAWSRLNRSANCNNAAFKFDLSSLTARLQTNSLAFDEPGLTSVCLPDQLAFENLSIGGETFIWDFGDNTQIVTTDTFPMVHHYRDEGQYIVKLKALDPNTCKEVDSTSVVVNIHKSHSNAQEDDDLCVGSQYQLDAFGGVSYEWRILNGEAFSTQEDPFISPTDTTIYMVKIIDANGCENRDTVKINVIEGINPEFRFQRKTDCSTAPTLYVENLTDSLRDGDQMFFDFGDGTTSDQEEVTHVYDNDGVYSVKLVSAREHCVFEKVEPIPMFHIKIPNVISPDGTTGWNDKFTVQFGEGQLEAGDPVFTPADYGFKVSLMVYNRWGKILFESQDYQYDWAGQELSAGIYFYELTVEEHSTCKSWLHIVR
jgi:hypothetical protein